MAALNRSTEGAAMENNISDEEDKKVAILRSLPFFSSFNDQELLIILDMSKWLKFAPGDFVVKEGESENSFYIIMKGNVLIRKKVGVSNMKKTISHLKKGECLGEMSLLTGQPRTADVIAEEETFLLKIDSYTLNGDTESFELRSIQFKFYKKFSEILAQRLAQTNKIAVTPL